MNVRGGGGQRGWWGYGRSFPVANEVQPESGNTHEEPSSGSKAGPVSSLDLLGLDGLNQFPPDPPVANRVIDLTIDSVADANASNATELPNNIVAIQNGAVSEFGWGPIRSENTTEPGGMRGDVEMVDSMRPLPVRRFYRFANNKIFDYENGALLYGKGGRFDLTPLAASILRMLVEKPGETVGWERLKTCWPENVSVEIGTPHRKKIISVISQLNKNWLGGKAITRSYSGACIGYALDEKFCLGYSLENDFEPESAGVRKLSRPPPTLGKSARPEEATVDSYEIFIERSRSIEEIFTSDVQSIPQIVADADKPANIVLLNNGSSFNSATLELRQDGRVVWLSLSQKSILAVLVSRPGHSFWWRDLLFCLMGVHENDRKAQQELRSCVRALRKVIGNENAILISGPTGDDYYTLDAQYIKSKLTLAREDWMPREEGLPRQESHDVSSNQSIDLPAAIESSQSVLEATAVELTPDESMSVLTVDWSDSSDNRNSSVPAQTSVSYHGENTWMHTGERGVNTSRFAPRFSLNDSAPPARTLGKSARQDGTVLDSSRCELQTNGSEIMDITAQQSASLKPLSFENTGFLSGRGSAHAPQHIASEATAPARASEEFDSVGGTMRASGMSVRLHDVAKVNNGFIIFTNGIKFKPGTDRLLSGKRVTTLTARQAMVLTLVLKAPAEGVSWEDILPFLWEAGNKSSAEYRRKYLVKLVGELCHFLGCKDAIQMCCQKKVGTWFRIKKSFVCNWPHDREEVIGPSFTLNGRVKFTPGSRTLSSEGNEIYLTPNQDRALTLLLLAPAEGVKWPEFLPMLFEGISDKSIGYQRHAVRNFLTKLERVIGPEELIDRTFRHNTDTSYRIAEGSVIKSSEA